MKDFKKGFYLVLLSISLVVGLWALKVSDAGNDQLASQIVLTWVGMIVGGVLFLGGFLFVLLRK